MEGRTYDAQKILMVSQLTDEMKRRWVQPAAMTYMTVEFS